MTTPVERIRNLREEEVYGFIVDTLRQLLRGEVQMSGASDFDVTSGWLVAQLLSQHSISEHNDKLNARSAVSDYFQSVLWELSLKGVLRPSSRRPAVDPSLGAHAGNGFCFTSRGKEWLLTTGTDPVLVSSKTLHSLIKAHESRYGSAFARRAEDALKSLEARAYVACCAMCGAAAESILLAAAIEKTKDPMGILKLYNTRQGRRELENKLEHGKPGDLVREMQAGFWLLKYWRDDAAHGAPVDLDVSNARAALNALLNLAQFVSDRWNEITS